ncbi:MAG: KpsF/GutQ family sugar-phosphate isomerase [Natronohydrobacter sp.]|nr:KpsF/GutQ family sugar-phosphate isomerase [Natronohydrobacter sp.]
MEARVTDLQAIGFGQDVLRAEAGALETLADTLDTDFARAVDLILATKGRLIVAGIGKSGHVGRKIAATFASTGTPAHFVHAAEASHGDLGMITPDDICLLLSRSGETQELGDLISYTRRFGVTLISISANAESTLARASDVALILPDVAEVCAIGMAPTTSTTMSMALGDALAVAVMRAKGFDPARFHQFHPGGKLGAQFLRVSELMVTGDALPLVAEDTAMPEVLMRMTGSGYGVAILTDGDTLRGIVTDGDLRRHMNGLMTRRAGDVATRAPKTIRGEALVSEAVQVMNSMKVTALCVVEGDRLTGLIRLHDCLRAGVI